MNNRHFSVFRVTKSHILSILLYTHWLSAHCENVAKTAIDMSKVVSSIQSTWLSRQLKASVQSEVADFFK